MKEFLFATLLFAVCTAGRGSAAAPPVTAVAISPDGREVVSGSQAGLWRAPLEALKKRRPLATSLEQIHAVRFSPDGTRLAAVGGVPAESGRVELFHWPDGGAAGEWDLGEDVAFAVDWLDESRSLVVGGFDGRAWSIPPDGQHSQLWNPGHSRGLTAVCVLPPGEDDENQQLVGTGSIDQTLRVTNIATSQTLRTLHNHTAAIHSIALRPAGPSGLPVVSSVSDDRTVRFWQPTIGRMMRFARLDAVPLSQAWTADGARLAVGCSDGQLRLIDPETSALRHTVSVNSTPLVSLASHPSAGSVVVGTFDGEVHLVPLPE